MRGHGLAGPDRADFFRSVVTDRDDEVELGSAGTENSSHALLRRPSVGTCASRVDAGLLAEPFLRDGFQRCRR